MKLKYSDIYIKINGIIVFIGIPTLEWGCFTFLLSAFLGASDKPIWPQGCRSRRRYHR